MASGSRALKSSGDLNLIRTVDDDGIEITGNNDDAEFGDNDDDHNNNYTKMRRENDYSAGDSVSDLLDSFNRNRSEQKCRIYRYAQLPKPLTTNMHQLQLHPIIDDLHRLERSQSVCSLQTGLRNRFNGKATASTSTPSRVLNMNGHQHRYQSLQSLNQKHWQRQQLRPSSPSPSLPATLSMRSNGAPGGSGGGGGGGSVIGRLPTIAQLEQEILHHHDIRRNSLSSRRGTRNFVINPLYNEQFKWSMEPIPFS